MSTESRLDAIAIAAPEHRESLAEVAAGLDPAAAHFRRVKARNEVTREAARLMKRASVSGTAKFLADRLGWFIAKVLPRERDQAAPPAGSAERELLRRIARLNDGEGLGWRRILQIIEE